MERGVKLLFIMNGYKCFQFRNRYIYNFHNHYTFQDQCTTAVVPLGTILMVLKIMEFGLKLYLLFSILTFLNGYEYYDDMRAVKQKLLRKYNVDAVPKSTSNVSLVVNATLYVMALSGLDEKHQILSMSVFWVIRWQDVIFKWDNTKYKNVKVMTVKVRDLWVPDVFVVNALKDMRVSRLDENEYVNALSDGHMTWYPSTELMTSCSVDISKYPFDIQVCSIRIESWYHNSKDFVLKPGNPGIDFSESHFSRKWRMESY